MSKADTKKMMQLSSIKGFVRLHTALLLPWNDVLTFEKRKLACLGGKSFEDLIEEGEPFSGVVDAWRKEWMLGKKLGRELGWLYQEQP